jgi:hypothetical protein
MDDKKKWFDAYRQGLLKKLEHIKEPDDLMDLADWIDALETVEAFSKTNDLFSDIRDELGAAEKYLAKYQASGNQVFKTVGLEELRHADQMIAVVQQEAVTPCQQDQLHDLQAQVRTLMSQFQ